MVCVIVLRHVDDDVELHAIDAAEVKADIRPSSGLPFIRSYILNANVNLKVIIINELKSVGFLGLTTDIKHRRKEPENVNEEPPTYIASDIEEDDELIEEEIAGIGILLGDHNYLELIEKDYQVSATLLKKSVPKRWKATCIMMKSISLNFAVIEALLVGTDKRELLFSVKEKKNIVTLLNFLELFKTATDMLQGEKNPTLSWKIPTVDTLIGLCIDSLEVEIPSEDESESTWNVTNNYDQYEEFGVGNMGPPLDESLAVPPLQPTPAKRKKFKEVMSEL
ncbi:hypothetical protein OUZ56_003655 [Daphnia magna]|uniref:Uncharacterized protein n=1 Tax=Daphnia magna TaxID=35525 RepID=A0ABR0A9D3_9CRUS|nr:hypothetical protein OUZ56_003655 [Daphnia magna]